jgi:uncharacterized protein
MTRTATMLVVMARYPTVGAVKTRLARTIGAAAACALYRAFLADLDARFGRGRRPLVWAYDPPDADFAPLVRPGAVCVPQEGPDLGARMHNVVRRFCADGTRRVLIIGADAPHLRDAWVDEADEALGDADLVLGPSTDGGYYLIGMRQPHDVFTGVAMGTSGVLAATLVRAAALGLRVHRLPETFDVDEAADLDRLRRAVADSPDLALPTTLAVLATIT